MVFADTQRKILLACNQLLYGRDEKGIERREDGRNKDREIPETELHKMFSLGLVLRITDTPPINSLIDVPHVQPH